MTLKLMLAVYCAVVAFAAPPGKQEIFDINREETAAQTVCDDPCLLCTLLQNYVEQIKELINNPDEKQQLPYNQQSHLKTKEFLSLAKVSQGPPGGFRKREAVNTEDLSLARIAEARPPIRPPWQNREAVARIAEARPPIRPPWQNREAHAVTAEDTCIDVCGQCSAITEKKTREQKMTNAIIKMLLSQ